VTALARIVLEDRDDVEVARFGKGVVHVAHVGGPDLVPGTRLEEHLALLVGATLRLVQAVEVTVGPQDPADGPDAQMDAHLLESGPHPERSELRVLLQAPHGVHRPQVDLSDAFRPSALPVLEPLWALLDPAPHHPVDGGTVHAKVPRYALVRPPLVVQRDDGLPALGGVRDLVVRVEATKRPQGKGLLVEDVCDGPHVRLPAREDVVNVRDLVVVQSRVLGLEIQDEAAQRVRKNTPLRGG